MPRSPPRRWESTSCVSTGSVSAISGLLLGGQISGKRLRYQTYDGVIGLMHAGDNVLGAQLSGTAGIRANIGNDRYQFAGGCSRALLCQLEITYDDGVELIGSSATRPEEGSEVHLVPQTLYGREDYDARLENRGVEMSNSD